MAESTIWWLGAGAAIAVELVTGTFYLLMIATGLAAAAIAAHLGAGTVVQFITAAVVGGGAVVGWYLRRRRRPSEPAARANSDVNQDIGATVYVDAWNPDGTASVQYRGANWTVIHRSGNAPSAGAHRVAEVIGNRLVLDKT